jgi:hypothetical protein
MRYLALAAATFVLVSTIGCRRQQSDETGGVNDTVRTPVAAPATETADTALGVRDFSFDRRQEFAQSIRQQLADLDRQISELSSQAKSLGGAVSDQALANVRASRRAVGRTLSRVEAATAANWEQVREGVNRAVENLDESIQAAQPK